MLPFSSTVTVHSFQELAGQLAVPFLILDFQASKEVLRERIDRRLAEGGDPSEANQNVLDAQLKNQQPLTAAEQAVSIKITPEKKVEVGEIEQHLKCQATALKA